MNALIALAWDVVGFWLSLVGVITTIIALALAILQGATILWIRESLSTQYVGHAGLFPEFMPAITRMIESAQHTIDILCDVPAYGFFADHRDWLAYESAIKQKLNLEDNVEVRILCLGQKERSANHDSQFADAYRQWNEWKRRAEIRPKLGWLMNQGHMTCSVDELTPEGFKAVVEAVYKETMTNSFRAVSVCELDIPLGIHLWIIDGQKAVYAIPSHFDVDIELGFLTSDARLIARLKSIFNRYLEKASAPPRAS